MYVTTGYWATGYVVGELTAQPGNYTVDGNSAQLLKSKLIASSSGLYEITGQDASVRYRRNMYSVHGEYSYQGSAITIMLSRGIWIASSTPKEIWQLSPEAIIPYVAPGYWLDGYVAEESQAFQNIWRTETPPNNIWTSQ